MALPAFLIPALTGFAISKLTGASTKKELQSALLGAAVGGITQGFTADAAAKQLSTDAITGVSGAERAALGLSESKIAGGGGIMDNIRKGFGSTSKFLEQKIPGFGDTTVGQGALYGIGG